MTTAASTATVTAAIPAAVHTPRDDEDALAVLAVVANRSCFEPDDDFPAACWCATLLSGGASVPTGCTVGAALNPQSSRAAPSR
jgi:hypothetical protein